MEGAKRNLPSLVRADDSRFRRFLHGRLDGLLGIPAMNRLFAPLRNEPLGSGDFFRRCGELFALEVRAEGTLEPGRGLMLACNHPRGLLDVFAVGAYLDERFGREMRLFGNEIMAELIPELEPYMILVRNMGKRNPARKAKNREALAEAAAWLRGGGVMAMTPAGEVSSLRLHSPEGWLRISDHDWYATFVAIARKGEADIVPLHIEAGRNRLRFYLARLLGRGCGRMLNFRELVAVRPTRVTLRFAEPLSFEEFRGDDDAAVAERVRHALYAARRTDSSL